MTAMSTTKWMRKKDYLKRWLLRVNQLSQDDKDLKSNLGRPVGNSTKMMPWDCSLNKDIKNTVMRHMWLLGLPTNPGAQRWLSISSDRILQDVAKVFQSIKKIQ
jgi:hypothetical protein